MADHDLEQGLKNRIDTDHLRNAAEKTAETIDKGSTSVDKKVEQKARELGLPTDMDNAEATEKVAEKSDRDDPPINPAAPVMNG